MRKLLVSLVMVVTLATSALFAQEGETSRSISAYLTADSGYMFGSQNWVSKVDGGDSGSELFADSSYEFGIQYAQNFAGNGMDWLSAYLKLVAGANGRVAEYDSNDGGSEELNALAADLGVKFDNFYAELGVGVNGSVFGLDALNINLAVDTDVKVTFGADYAMEIGPGTLAFGLGVEFYAYPEHEGKAIWNDTGSVSEDVNRMFDSAYLTVGYGLEFAEIWSVASTLEFGYRYIDGENTIHEQDNGTWSESGVFNNDLYLQWDVVEVAVNLNGGFSAWAGLRLKVDNLLPYLTESGDNSDYVARDIAIELNARAGISYVFDL